MQQEEVRQEAGGEPTGVQALCDGGGVDQVALTQATCDVGVDVTEFNLPRQHVGVLQQEGKGEVRGLIRKIQNIHSDGYGIFFLQAILVEAEPEGVQGKSDWTARQ